MMAVNDTFHNRETQAIATGLGRIQTMKHLENLVLVFLMNTQPIVLNRIPGPFAISHTPDLNDPDPRRVQELVGIVQQITK